MTDDELLGLIKRMDSSGLYVFPVGGRLLIGPTRYDFKTGALKPHLGEGLMADSPEQVAAAVMRVLRQIQDKDEKELPF